MDALHAVIRKIRSDPADPAASTLRSLVKSLDAGEHFDLNALYQLNYFEFSLALNLIKQWRLDSFRYERGWATKAAQQLDQDIGFPAWMHDTQPNPSLA